MSTMNEAERAEKEGDWKKAEGHWRACGYHAHAEACKTIHEAIRKGDEYRALASRKLKEAGLDQETTEPTRQHMVILNRAYYEIYGRLA